MRPSSRSAGWILLLFVALIACKKSKASTETSSQSPSPASADAAATNVGAEFEKKLEPVFAAIEKTGKALPPRITRGYLKLDSSKEIGDTAELIHAEDMNDLTYPPTQFQTYRVAGSGIFLSCARVVRKNDTSVSDPAKKLQRCANAEYLIVIRTKKLDEPKSHNGLQFISGKVDGDVLVYSLPSMKLLGGFPYTAESSKQVREGEIEKDMQQNWAKAMADGLSKLHPSSRLSFSF